VGKLSVQHLIFTRVESSYSPKQSSGYQVVYQSDGLQAEARQIEKRLQCFDSSQQENERYQFFWTTRGQAVLARTFPLGFPTNREVIDRWQRAAFLAHALVLSKEAFASIHHDPFTLFDLANSPFVADDEQLVDYLRGETLDEQLNVPLRTSRDVNYLLSSWSEEELWKLFALGMQTDQLKKKKQSLLLLSEEAEDALDLLRLTTFLLPPENRLACTFDTYIETCMPPPGLFWLVCGKQGKNQAGFLPMRLSAQALEAQTGFFSSFPAGRAGEIFQRRLNRLRQR